MDSASLLNLIHSEGYWRVVLRPPEFHEARLKDKAHCQSELYQAAVANEVGHYPVLGHSLLEEGPDWIAGGANVMTVIEYWRLFQSGQFVHHLATREDHMARLGLFHPQFFVPGTGKKYFAITATVCMITDIVEFAARLAYRQVLVPSALLTIEINRMEGRQLTFMAPGRRLTGTHWFKDARVQLKSVLAAEDLVGRAKEIAIDLATDLFSRAGWDAPRAILLEDQNRYTQSRR